MRNQHIIEEALEQLKIETAAELGIEINENILSRDAGKIGGNITKKLIALGEMKLVEMYQSQEVKINPAFIPNQTINNHNQLH